jgi:hypothetical protein
MPNKILLRRSTVPGASPTTSDLSLGELAINPEDKRIYFKDTGNNIQYLQSLYASSIDDLADVDTQSTAPQAGDGLVWDVASQSWIPSPVSQPLSIESLDQLGNISLTVDTVYNMRFDVGFGVTDLGNGSVKLTNLAASFGNLDAGLPNSNYGGIAPIDCGGVSR